VSVQCVERAGVKPYSRYQAEAQSTTAMPSTPHAEQIGALIPATAAAAIVGGELCDRTEANITGD